MNPLDIPNQPLKFEGHNITAIARTSKDGPRYRISLECDKEVFDAVITGRLEGAAFAISMCRVDYDMPDDSFVDANRVAAAERKKKPKSPKGPLELRAYELCRDIVFREYLFDVFRVAFCAGDARSENEKLAADFIKEYCRVSHRSQIDKSREAAVAFGILVSDFEKWKGISE